MSKKEGYTFGISAAVALLYLELLDADEMRTKLLMNVSCDISYEEKFHANNCHSTSMVTYQSGRFIFRDTVTYGLQFHPLIAIIMIMKDIL